MFKVSSTADSGRRLREEDSEVDERKSGEVGRMRAGFVTVNASVWSEVRARQATNANCENLVMVDVYCLGAGWKQQRSELLSQRILAGLAFTVKSVAEK
mmetsp:Transcript_23882/g.40857  ORF Transcript_23882/g.40857 Transcript_23882/m.40857 type:complete len:99 (+) Transcript_23882:1367-1663(+)